MAPWQVARARWLLCVLLWAAATANLRTPPPFCPSVREATPRAEGPADWTRAVACAGGRRDPAALRGPARLLFGLPLDPNRADLGTLEVLPGIGPARAAAWVAERERRPFCTLPDLERVVGIGPRTRARVAPLLRIEAVPGCSPGGREKAARP